MNTAVEIGLERVQRAVTLLMAQNLNDEISAVNAIWDARDATFFSAMGRANPQFTCEMVSPDNMYSGTIPSLISSPREAYPNLCVIAYIAAPRRTDDDWCETYDLALAVEIMVKSERSEEEVNARIQRTIEAAHSVLTSDKTRRIPEGNDGENLVPQISNTPNVTIGDVFVKHGSAITDTDPNDRWFWQGGRLQYSMEKLISY